MEAIGVRDGDLARSTLSLDWVQNLSEKDMNAITLASLGKLAMNDSKAFNKVMSHPTLADGITEEQAPVLPY